MKKKLILFLSAILIPLCISSAIAKPAGTELSNAIKMYKQGNYTQCYATLLDVVKKDSSNALAYYYLAIASVQVGKRDEAINNYNKVMSLVPNKANTMYTYALKGKTCLEEPDKCNSDVKASELEQFISRKNLFSDKVQSEYDKLKIENIMREINSSNDIDINKFKEYKDYSKHKSEAMPTDEEIVTAFRTLQKAGLINSFNSQEFPVFGEQNQYPQNQLMDLLGGNSDLRPQLIQSLLTNNMSLAF